MGAEIETAKQLIIEGQGFSETPYNDTKGYATIGYGHLIQPNEKQKLTHISEEDACNLLQKDVTAAVGRCQNWLGADTYKGLSDTRKAVLIDMVYTLADKINQFVKLKEALQEGDFAKAAQQIENSKYHAEVKLRGIRNVKIMRDDQVYPK